MIPILVAIRRQKGNSICHCSSWKVCEVTLNWGKLLLHYQNYSVLAGEERGLFAPKEEMLNRSMAIFLHIICYLGMRWSKAVNVIIFYSAIKGLSNCVKLKSLRSNKFKQQLSKYFPSATLPIRLTFKQKQTKNLPFWVSTTPAVWFPQQSVVLLLGPLVRNKSTPTNDKFYLHEFPPPRSSHSLTYSL